MMKIQRNIRTKQDQSGYINTHHQSRRKRSEGRPLSTCLAVVINTLANMDRLVGLATNPFPLVPRQATRTEGESASPAVESSSAGAGGGIAKEVA
jgi:hypothetical protein